IANVSNRFLLETTDVLFRDILERAVGRRAGRMIQLDREAIFPVDPAVRITPLSLASRHAETIRKPGRHDFIDELVPCRIADNAARRNVTPEIQTIDHYGSRSWRRRSSRGCLTTACSKYDRYQQN